MKLETTKHDIERSSNFKKDAFEIGNATVIMRILRSKMYSNPIQTICQEIMSNARDAHREVNNPDPIEIKLPNRLNDSFWIRDFGPGITPDRMVNVFIKYGNSTKRATNQQTGGFGLGAKSPFSYVDTFVVITVTEENGVRTKRQYLAHVNETDDGEMSCVSEEPTDEPCGTTISLTPKSQSDWTEFARQVKRTAAYWDVKPNIKGMDVWDWPEFSVAHKGKNWALHNASNHADPGMSLVFANEPIAIIDGIAYRINLHHVYPEGFTPRLALGSRLKLRLYFEVGELLVTANREDLDYQKETIALVKQRLEQALSELEEKIIKGLETQPNLTKAIYFWQNLKRQSYKNLLDETKWKGIQLKDVENLRFPQDVKAEITLFIKDPKTRSGCRKESGKPSGVYIERGTLLVENDIRSKSLSIPRSRLATLFSSSKVKLVYVVSFNVEKKRNPQTDILGVSLASEAAEKARKQIADKEVNYHLYAPIKLSAIPKKDLTASEAPATKTKRYKVKKLCGGCWDPVEDLGELEKDPNAINCYVFRKGQGSYVDRECKRLIRQRGLETAVSHIKRLIDSDNFQVFGVRPSYADKVPDSWTKLDDFVTKQYQIFYDKWGNSHHIGNSRTLFSPKLLEALRETDGLPDDLERYVKLCLETEKATQKAVELNSLRSALRPLNKDLPRPKTNPEVTESINDLARKIRGRYPLLRNLQYVTHTGDFHLDDIVDYAKLKEQKLGKAENETL